MNKHLFISTILISIRSAPILLLFSIVPTTFLLMCSHQPWKNTKNSIDRNDLPISIRKVRGYVYFAQDYNYKKTSALIYAHPQGIVFINSGWTRNTALQLITESLRYSDGDYLGVVPISPFLRHSGGLSEFRALLIPIITHSEIIKKINSTWYQQNQSMAQTFPSWKNQNLARPNLQFQKSFHFLDGRVIIYYLDDTHKTKSTCIVYFPDKSERLLYVGELGTSLVSTQITDQKLYQQALRGIERLNFKWVLSGSNSKLESRKKFLNRIKSL